MSPTTTPPPPDTLEERCPQCRTKTKHLVVKGRVVKGGRAVEGTFSCSDCLHVHQGLVRFAEPEHIPFIISQEAESVPATVPVFADDEVRIGDEFEIEEELVEVTGIEIKDEHRRVKSARADRIHTLWGKNIDTIRVGFSLNEGETTRAIEVDFGPDDEISVGDKFDLEDSEVIVDRLMTTEGKRNRGTFNVREIKRVWLKRAGRQQNGPTKSARDSSPAKAPRRSGPPRRPTQGAPVRGPSERPRSSGGRSGPPRSGGSGPRGPARSGGPRSNAPNRSGPGASRSSGPSRGGPSRGGPGASRSSGPSRGGPSRGGPGASRSSGPGPARGGAPGGRSSGGPSRGPARGAGGSGRPSGGPSRGPSGGGGRGPGRSSGGPSRGPSRSGGPGRTSGGGPSRGGAGGRGPSRGPVRGRGAPSKDRRKGSDRR